MANNVLKVNSIAIANIAKINGQTDSDLAKLNGEEFTGVTDAHVFIASDLASKGDGSHASLGFTSGIDSTYDVYEFVYTNIHGETDRAQFCFQVEVGTGTTYEQTITSTFFYAYHYESGSGQNLQYYASSDQAQGDALQHLSIFPDFTQGDSSVSGKLTLYAPSSGDYVKHFMSETNNRGDAGGEAFYSVNAFSAGYINTATAVTRIKFAFDSGEIQGGAIKMYGIAKS